jgi:hypothetical protein
MSVVPPLSGWWVIIVWTSETLVNLYQSTWCYNPADSQPSLMCPVCFVLCWVSKWCHILDIWLFLICASWKVRIILDRYRPKLNLHKSNLFLFSGIRTSLDHQWSKISTLPFHLQHYKEVFAARTCFSPPVTYIILQPCCSWCQQEQEHIYMQWMCGLYNQKYFNSSIAVCNFFL